MPDEHGAWLEATDGKRLAIQGNLSIGRSPKNLLVLDSQKISRRHAIINVQNVGEFWLIDLGSSNGTFLNKRRVHQPIRLCDLDQIIIGDYVFTFRQPIEMTDEYQSTVIERTIREIENVPCWFLVDDIENFTPLSRSLTSDRLATLIGGGSPPAKKSSKRMKA
jgi:adenylate cyclase